MRENTTAWLLDSVSSPTEGLRAPGQSVGECIYAVRWSVVLYVAQLLFSLSVCSCQYVSIVYLATTLQLFTLLEPTFLIYSLLGI